MKRKLIVEEKSKEGSARLEGHFAEYNLSAVQSIEFPYAWMAMSADDRAGNGVEDNDVLIWISFYDGTEATFREQAWRIRTE